MIEKINFTYDFIQERCNDNYSKRVNLIQMLF